MNFFRFAQEPSLAEKTWMAIRYPIDLVRSPFQALVSIPTLSFLVIPAFSSYGTSINLLFFYVTWAILVKSNDPIRIEFFGTLGIRILFYVLPSLCFLAFDIATPNLAISIKEHRESALPLGEEQDGKKGRWWKVALVSIGNVLLGVVLQLGVELLFTQVLHLRSVLRVSTSIPLPWTIARDLSLGLVLRETLTYIFHRYALHSPQSPIAHIHMTWQHSVLTPFSLVAHYDHPIAYLFHIFLPMYLPAALLRFHLLTYNIYLTLISLEENFAYSGYNVLPSAFILGGIARRQEKHLMGKGTGNYGCLGLADFAMGTSLGADSIDDRIDEAEGKKVGKKARAKAEAIGRKPQEKAPDENVSEQGNEEDDQDFSEENNRRRRRKVSSHNKTKKKRESEPKKDELVERGVENKDSPRVLHSEARKDDQKIRGNRDEAYDEKPKPEMRESTRRGGLKGRSRSRRRRHSEDGG